MAAAAAEQAELANQISLIALCRDLNEVSVSPLIITRQKMTLNVQTSPSPACNKLLSQTERILAQLTNAVYDVSGELVSPRPSRWNLPQANIQTLIYILIVSLVVITVVGTVEMLMPAIQMKLKQNQAGAGKGEDAEAARGQDEEGQKQTQQERTKMG